MDMVRGLILIFCITIGSLAFCLMAFRSPEQRSNHNCGERVNGN